jgi:HAD superfamily hydrolase (TIGR01484 family)
MARERRARQIDIVGAEDEAVDSKTHGRFLPFGGGGTPADAAIKSRRASSFRSAAAWNYRQCRSIGVASLATAGDDHPPSGALSAMKQLAAFDLDGTLAESKQPLEPEMGEALADLLGVADVAVISGGDWPQFDKQVASRLPARADRARLWLMPTTGTKLYTHSVHGWQPVYAELFEEGQKRDILEAFDAALAATGFVPEEVWGERIEDRGSQITFSALGQQAPIHAKEIWDPDFAKRKIIQADLRRRLPGLSINIGGATSIDITREGVDKGYGLAKLRDASGIALDDMLFIGDAIFPGGNDYPALELGLDTVRVRDPQETLSVIAAIVACQRPARL